MLRWIQERASGIKPVIIDGFLYVVIAMSGSLEVALTSDDAYKYLNPYFIYFAKNINAVILAGITALKMYRSTSYSEHQEEKKAAKALSSGGNGGTTMLTKQQVEAQKENG